MVERQHRGDFHGQVAAVVHQCAPQFAAFPPAFVSRIGAENEQERNNKTQHGMHDGSVTHM